MLDREGPIHDVQWSPTGRDFAIIYGFIPGKATLFGEKAKPKFEFGSVSFNTIVWAPSGRFLCLAGFGSLNGDMDFYDMNKMKKMGSTNSRYAVTAKFSPDSRFFATAVTTPRRRMDNNFKIFKYNGTKIFEEAVDELYQFDWRSAPRGIYPDRPQSPNRQGPQASAAAAPKAQKYVPPSMRGRAGAEEFVNSVAQEMAKLRGVSEVNATAGKVENTAPQSAAAKKNAKKREAKKRAAEAAAEAAALGEVPPEQAKPAPTAEKAAAPVEETPSAEPSAEDAQRKKIRSLEKKLKEIRSLKEKQAAGTELNEAQQKKVGNETQLLSELEQLMA